MSDISNNSKNNNVDITLYSYDHHLIDAASKKIIDILSKENIELSGPIPFPIKKTRYTVSKAPNKGDKKREQFERRRYKRLIRANLTKKALEALSGTKLSNDIQVSLRIQDKNK